MPLAHRSQRRQDPSLSESPSPSTSPYLHALYYNPQFDKTAFSTPIPSTIDLNYTYPTTDLYYIDSRESTPSDHFNYGLSDTPYMQNSSQQYPQVRVEQSIPNGLPSAHSPPPMIDENDFAQPSWTHFQESTYLAPNAQQQFPLTDYRTHKRAPSNSSIGSAGPDSPYTQSSAYPQIVDSDAQSVHSAHLESYDGSYSSGGQYSKPTFPSPLSQTSDQSFYPAFQGFNLQGNDAVSIMGGQTGMERQQRASNVNGRPNPSGVLYGAEGDGSAEMRNNIPQLDRTMSDVYQDELYNPASIQTTAAPSGQARTSLASQGSLLSPQRTTFTNLLQAANNGHMSARAASPANSMGSRQYSHSHSHSQFAAGGSGFAVNAHSNPSSPATRLNSAAQIREQQRLVDAQAFAAQQQQSRHDLLNPPKTISPKEVSLDYNDGADDLKKQVPLFPSPKPESTSQALLHNTSAASASAISYDRQFARGNTDENSNASNDQSFGSMATTRRQSSSNYSTPSSAPTPQQPSSSTYSFVQNTMPNQYPFITQSRRQSSSMRSGASDQAPEFPASLTSMESTKSESGQGENVRLHPESSQRSAPSSQEAPTQRPSDMSAGSGSYICVAPDCHARFDTSAKLVKHRRDSHRASSPYGPTSSSNNHSSASTSHNPQAAQNNVSRNNAPGPHKCEKMNPSTGKPCNTVFSRSYDLTRHEDTIHNSRKQKVRCHLCTEEKTFSRNDALTRHMRVVHPDVDFPGKSRRGRNSEGADVVRQKIEGGRGGR